MEPLKKLIGGHTSWNTKANKYIISRFLEKLGMKREFMEEIKRKMIERKRQKKKKTYLNHAGRKLALSVKTMVVCIQSPSEADI